MMEISSATNPFNDFVFLNATPAERGAFTLALDKALDKLEKFQLPDPSYFVLQWIQALVAAGSQTIAIQLEVTFTGYSMRIGFDGSGYTARELQGLYDHVFLSGRDRNVDRLRELALGWLSASSLRPTQLSLRSNGWARVRDRAGGGAGKDVTSQVAVVEGGGLPHLLEIAGRGSYPFEQMILSNCTDVPVPLFVNGTQVSHPNVATGVPWPNRPFTNGPTRGVMGATYGAGSCSQIAFLRYGVSFVSRTEPALVPPVIMRVSDSTLSKNVSQTDVVRDEAYEEFLGRLRSEMKAMALSLSGKRIPSYQRDALNRYLQAYIASHLDIRALEDPNRLALLGPDYESLLNYPVFCSNKGLYRSLVDLHDLYKKQGCLLYCLESPARGVAWAGVLLVLELEEVAVLKKFFPNLIGLSLEEVRLQSRMGRSAVAGDGGANPVLARQSFEVSGRRYRVSVPDCYPTGIAVLQPLKSRFGTAVPGLPVTLCIEYLDEAPPNHTEVVALQRGIGQLLTTLKNELATTVGADEQSFSRPRAAELLCEILNYELSQLSEGRQEADVLRFMDSVPVIGLEDGRLVSLRDIKTFLRVVPHVYVGGAFVEGLESGALDPMPEAARLLSRVLPPQVLISTSKIRDRLADNSELRFALRRQTLIRGLAQASDPKKVLERFASEAASEAAELARIEQEYRKALEGPVLFVKPDEERLASLAEISQEDDETPLPDQLAPPPRTPVPPAPPSDASRPMEVPSMEADMERCRSLDPDLFPEKNSLHVERRETGFSFHLATCAPGQGLLILLKGSQHEFQPVPHSVRGFLRLPSDPGALTSRQLYAEALEQLTIKALHAYQEGPPSAAMRKALRNWLFHLGCQLPERLASSEQRRNDLFDLPVVPCLGPKHLSWRTLLEQANRVGETVIYEGSPAKTAPDPQREVIALSGPLTEELLVHLGFPPARRHIATASGGPFDQLYRSTRRDLASVLSGQTIPLLETNLVEELAADASLWKKWRSGFLSWDREGSVVVMNPNHKLGKKLAVRFDSDPSWSRIFASALFSTINRGLEEVEDRHERTFLETLVETLD